MTYREMWDRIELTPKRSILITLAFTTFVILVRTWWTLRNGWLVGDEGLYIISMLESVRTRSFVYLSARHTIFMWFNTIVGVVFNLDTVFKVIPFLAIQALFWNGACAWSLHRVVRKMGLKPQAESAIYLSTSLVAIYVIMNGLYLTEAPSMTFTLMSIYFLLRVVDSRSPRSSFLAGLCITVAYLYREPYLIFIVLDALLLCYLVVRKRLSWKFLVLFLIVPIILVQPPVQYISLGIVQVYGSVREPFIEFYKRLVQPIVEAVDAPPVYLGGPPGAGRNYSIFMSPQLQLQVGTLDIKGDLVKRVRTTALVTARGIVYGWSILLALPVMVGMVEAFRLCRKDDSAKVVAITILSAFLSMVFVGWLVSPADYLMGSGATAIAIRFSYTTFPMILGIGLLYDRVNIDLKKVVMGFGVMILLVTPTLLTLVQTNQSEVVINRINLSYKASFYMLYEHVKDLPGETLVFPEPSLRAYVYLSSLDNVSIARLDLSEAQFLDRVGKHDQVFFYQEKWPRWWMVHEDNFPFLGPVVRNETQYRVLVVWDTPEAYLYELVK